MTCVKKSPCIMSRHYAIHIYMKTRKWTLFIEIWSNVYNNMYNVYWRYLCVRIEICTWTWIFNDHSHYTIFIYFSLVVGTIEADNGVGSVDIHTIVKYIQTKKIHRQTSVNTELYRIDRITYSVKILCDPPASQIARHKLHNQMK